MYAPFLLPVGSIDVPRLLCIMGDRPGGESKEESPKGVPSPELKLVKVGVVSETVSYRSAKVCCCTA